MKLAISIDKLTVHRPKELYDIMQAVLRREESFDKRREHFWVVALDCGKTILSLEHISTGSATRTIVEPAEVLSIPLQKSASGIMLAHNHPSGSLEPSEEDKDVTDRLIQAGRLMKVPVLDHLIITEHSYYSFKAAGLLTCLEASNKYKLPYELEKEYHDELEQSIRALQKKHEEKLKETLEQGLREGEQKGAEQEKEQIARQMLSDGAATEKIQRWTGLSLDRIEGLQSNASLHSPQM